MNRGWVSTGNLELDSLDYSFLIVFMVDQDHINILGMN